MSTPLLLKLDLCAMRLNICERQTSNQENVIPVDDWLVTSGINHTSQYMIHTMSYSLSCQNSYSHYLCLLLNMVKLKHNSKIFYPRHKASIHRFPYYP